MRYLILALAVSEAAAFSVRALLSPRGFSALQARQLDPSQIPAQCQTPCAPIVADFQTCGANNTCVCSTKVANDYQSCLNCLAGIAAGLNDPTVSSAIASAATTFNNGCASLNPNLPPITAAAGSIPTSALGSASAATGFTTAGFSSAPLSSIGRSVTATSSLGPGGVSTGFGGGIGLSTQTAPTITAGAATAVGAGSPSGTAATTTKPNSGHQTSASWGVVVTGVIGAAAYLW